MEHTPSTYPQNQCRLGQGVVSYASGLDQNHAHLLRSIASFATRTQSPRVLRVNLAFVCEQMGRSLGEVITLLHQLQDAQVSVRTAHGEEHFGLVKGATPADATSWDIHLGGAGAWLLENARTSSWW